MTGTCPLCRINNGQWKRSRVAVYVLNEPRYQVYDCANPNCSYAVLVNIDKEKEHADRARAQNDG